MNVGVFGGTFDPVHLGHLVLAEHARSQIGLQRVLWVPAGDPWRKSDRAVSEARDRVEMVRRAIAGNATFELRDDEVKREGPSYTIDTLSRVHEEFPEAELFTLMGKDAMSDMPNWREPAQIMELSRLVVAGRAAQGSTAQLEQLQPGLPEQIIWLEMPQIAISSTDVRRRVREHASIRYLVPHTVEAYIRDAGLYQT